MSSIHISFFLQNVLEVKLFLFELIHSKFEITLKELEL